MRYIDTSVIVSALDPADPSRPSSTETLKKPGKVVSELVVTELSSVLLRSKNFVSLMDQLSGDRTSSSYAAIIYTLEKFDLMYLPTQITQIETPIGRYNSVMDFAIGIANKVPMRTLDLMHLSYAYSFSNLTRSKIEFVTRDREFKFYNREILDAVAIEISYIE